LKGEGLLSKGKGGISNAEGVYRIKSSSKYNNSKSGKKDNLIGRKGGRGVLVVLTCKEERWVTVPTESLPRKETSCEGALIS